MLKPEAVVLLRKVMDAIREEPRRLDMNDWGSQSTEERVAENPVLLPACGTQGCIAGWVRILGDKTFLPSVIREMGETQYSFYEFSGDTYEEARRLLGLTEAQANRLFFFKSWRAGRLDEEGRPAGWPENFSDAYLANDTPEGRRDATFARIEHFISTGGAE